MLPTEFLRNTFHSALDAFSNLRNHAHMPTAIYDPDRIAATVRRLRAEQGMHQTQLAKRAKLSRRTVVAIEAGTRASEVSYGKVAAALGVPLTQLLNGQGDQ